jgi:uncharacterized protein YuzE
VHPDDAGGVSEPEMDEGNAREIMDYSYDPEADALYVTLSTERIAKTVKLKDDGAMILVDVDENGQPVGVELVWVSRFGAFSEKSWPIFLKGEIEECEEGGFHISIPEIPGVHSQGETIEDAEKNVVDALKTLVAHRVRQ